MEIENFVIRVREICITNLSLELSYLKDGIKSFNQKFLPEKPSLSP